MIRREQHILHITDEIIFKYKDVSNEISKI
jgi:hypothetical protein